MAISTVKATINGTTYTLSLNSSTGAYEATVTAPSKSSYNQTNKYYDVSVTATDTAGNSTTVNSSDSTFGDDLKLYVTEKTAPVVTITSPASGAVLTNNKPTFTWKCSDADSGVNKDTIKLYVDGTEVSGTISASLSGTTYTCTYTPTSAIPDGSHTYYVACSDNDGNTATSNVVSFKIDTVPPVLNVTSPADNSVTNNATAIVAGTTNDATSSPVTLTVNGTTVPVSSNGQFTSYVTLEYGENTITIVSTDGAGRNTTVTRKVYYDNIAPEIKSISIVPNPVDAGKTFVISVKVLEQ